MAITNHERVGKGMELLKAGLGPFVERELENHFRERAHDEAMRFIGDDKILAKQRPREWDSAALLKLMWEAWNAVFSKTLGRAERNLVSELRDARNNWAHQQAFSGDDAERALDSMSRLLTAVGASQAADVSRMRTDLRRLVIDEQVRGEKRKGAGTPAESFAIGGVIPWREVVTPHKDVASGRYQQAEFAADLWQVHIGEGTDEYRDPVEFFRRTYITESLGQLLGNAARRLSGQGGDPVVQLQTNFGGGKTHSMLALYHLFSGTKPSELLGIDSVVDPALFAKLPKAKRVVLVGNKIPLGDPTAKPDGTVVRTLWGELAWQLGGKKAFAKLAGDDKNATNPGDKLRELFNEHGPCLILIDEWVAYARQLHDSADLPAGSFETQFTFAQALTESAKAARHCLVVVSLPASVAMGSPHLQTDDVEVGGIRGREALDRLANVVGRVESSWRPATAEEGFEIVRRRLFEPMLKDEQFKQRDLTSRAFLDLYKSQKPGFPSECAETEYEKRIKAAYPIHPEIFVRLYSDWSTLVKFQRTRGVLRLMAAVIHSLWEEGDRYPLILPSTIPIDDHRVQSELTRYLSENWVPVIEKDVDGPNSLPLRLDSENASGFGRHHACRRVARTIYLGSAPMVGTAHRGIEERRIMLGCAMPGESLHLFGDALRRMAAQGTYLYQDEPRYWYSTQPTVTKLADDRAHENLRSQDKLLDELDKRLRLDLRRSGQFSRVHALPQSSADVPDEMEARLVVLSAERSWSKDPANTAQKTAREILDSRGNSPRIYRNALVFLAADKSAFDNLKGAIARYLAWESILHDKMPLNLDPHQVKQAEKQLEASNKQVDAQIPEAYQWALVPVQAGQQSQMTWQPIKVTGSEPLAERVSKRLVKEELLITVFAGTRLRMELDRVPLWRGDHVTVSQLAEDFAKYTYLPRLVDGRVLAGAVQNGVGLLTWGRETFAYADSYDEASLRYRGLKGGQNLSLGGDAQGVVVKPEVALAQMEMERVVTPKGEASAPVGGGVTTPESGEEVPPPHKTVRPTRFHGTVSLDPTRVGRDASRIAEEVIVHLAGLVGTDVRVSLEISAEIPEGTPENVVRTVTENARVLKFGSHGFEVE